MWMIFSLTIHADVSLHIEKPLFSFGYLMHLGIALAGLILRRGGRADDRGVYDRAGADLDSLLVQMPVHRLKQRFAQFVLLQQVTELAHCGLVRSRPGQPGERMLTRVTAQSEALIKASARVSVISPDEASLAAIGPRTMDVVRRPQVARAAWAQGAAAVDAVARFWDETRQRAR